ncbi:hypothetical protein ABZ687_29030 [Streptomyces ardesiacus]|uniref:hypothetical protein n=1 Tax=Streptomyces ardesiacus TaxID=285564 RepID=UPI0033C50582
MSTPTERADEMAGLVIAAAQQDNACVVTSALVDTVLKLHAGTEEGKANAVSVRRRVRARAAAAGVRVVLTDEERYWAIREQLHHMSGDQVHALRDSIAEGGELDPRGHDQVLVDAISARLSQRLPPRRLGGVEPVSVRLWEEPGPDAVGAMPEYAEQAPVVAALGILRAAGVRVATVPGRKMPYRDWYGPQGPQGAFLWPVGRTLEVSWFIDGAQDERGMRSRDSRTVRAARNQALQDVADAFRGAGWTVWRVLSRRTATRRDLRVDVTPPSDEERRARLAAITGPIEPQLAEAFAEMYAAVADGTAIPVPVTKARPGMVVVAAVRLEDRTIDTVRHSGPGQPSVSVTWTFRGHDHRRDSVLGDARTFPTDHHLMVTVESLESLGMLARPVAPVARS